MCSIIGSFSKQKIIDLITLNQHRGDFAYSITYFDILTHQVIEQKKEFGLFDIKKIKDYSSSIYYICHLQLPTNGLSKNIDRIHPTKEDNSFLFHNGILKPSAIKYIQHKFKTDISFDTQLLHKLLPDWAELNYLEGLFACLYIQQKNINIFRTKHAKLYIDNELTISSERFNDSKCINYDTIYSLNLKNRDIKIVNHFQTKRYNIIIQGEL